MGFWGDADGPYRDPGRGEFPGFGYDQILGDGRLPITISSYLAARHCVLHSANVIQVRMVKEVNDEVEVGLR
jgi:hypothetical protein